MGFEVEVRNVDGAVTALGAAGPFTLVVDSPAEAGGGGRGFNGGQLLHLAVAGCVSNDLFREAARREITLTRVVVTVDGGYGGRPVVSTGISYSVEWPGQPRIGPGRPGQSRRQNRRDSQLAAPGTPVTLDRVNVSERG